MGAKKNQAQIDAQIREALAAKKSYSTIQRELGVSRQKIADVSKAMKAATEPASAPAREPVSGAAGEGEELRIEEPDPPTGPPKKAPPAGVKKDDTTPPQQPRGERIFVL